MPGPMPKRNPARRNKTATRAVLVADHDIQAPDLPDQADGWHPQTLEWWRDVWASPMAPEYDESDRHGLFMLAVLVDSFWRNPSEKLASEIRLQRQCFGLTPIDRRRLQWEIERTDEAQAKGRQRREAEAAGKSKAPTKANDPRSVLRAVS
jgi:hypothetical protein